MLMYSIYPRANLVTCFVLIVLIAVRIVCHLCLVIRWYTVPHLQTGSNEAVVTKCVKCLCGTTYVLSATDWRCQRLLLATKLMLSAKYAGVRYNNYSKSNSDNSKPQSWRSRPIANSNFNSFSSLQQLV